MELDPSVYLSLWAQNQAAVQHLGRGEGDAEPGREAGKGENKREKAC